MIVVSNVEVLVLRHTRLFGMIVYQTCHAAMLLRFNSSAVLACMEVILE
jgi:hypothetical protein